MFAFIRQASAGVLIGFCVLLSISATKADAAAIKWQRAQLLSWSPDSRGGIDITLAPIKPSRPSLECMEYWHGDAELPLGPAGAFRRDRCS
jgi:hypothetical protein